MTIVDEAPPACPHCGAPALRPRSPYCSTRCTNAAYRAANIEKCRKGVNAANKRRLQRDPEYRASHRAHTRRWRRAAQSRMSSKAPKGEFRSGMEARIVPALVARGARYEPLFLRYPAKPRGYTPDVVLPNGIVLEIKGWFTPADRAKMLAVKAAYPALDIRMVLASPRQKIGRKSETTQAKWCEKHGFPWADNSVPDAWLSAPVNAASQAILEAAPLHNKSRRAKAA